MIEIADVEAAAGRIAPHAVRTPVVSSTNLSRLAGAELLLKAEMLQRTGSFKFRGATNAIAALDAEVRAAGIVAYSSGNHAQAISRAAGLHDVPATIVMPTDAPRVKRAATEHWGASIIEYDRYTQDRKQIAEDFAASTGGTIIPPYDHHDVMAGQGTAALELFDDAGALDMLFVCVGGGGLLAGSATVAKARNPNVIIVGVEPAAGNDHVLSRAAGKRVELAGVPDTIADGQQTTAPGVLTWQVNDRLVDHFDEVTDDQLLHTMRLLFEHTKLVAEPSGASALAAALDSPLIEDGMRVGVTLSGGNVDPRLFSTAISTAGH